ncbi:hypothetical protein J4E08_21125 [Sagittula sp. NFXS13]|uniref:hypothetical protein n=1 Tax=Sagittula sp. NFXS13 TaxID=2819095 RepID=UPI0032DE895D
MSEAMRHLSIAGLLALMPLCAQAADVFQAPAGCETFLTVQMKECRVEHHYRCAASGSDQWRAVYVEQGPIFVSRIDAQAQWLSSIDIASGRETVTVMPVKDPSDVTALIETGQDAFDFQQRRADGSVERVFGEDRIVERNVLLDGELLHRTVFEVTYQRADGSEIGTYSGSEYVSEAHQRFFAGRGTSVFDGVSSSFDRTPQEFIYPGEPGFASVTPVYDCGMMMSALR